MPGVDVGALVLRQRAETPRAVQEYTRPRHPPPRPWRRRCEGLAARGSAEAVGTAVGPGGAT
ncbi:hypothetical protein [Parafrankia discariae]|uniref:hypothetical protein n=1 Tax=Parafrankia discariae TaxID=365528 RepID=UPI00039AC7F8|nr:hypothetical protein [Parafrankia discariae]